MEKRVILAFVLCFIVLYVFSALNTPPPSSGPPAGVESTGNPPQSTNQVITPPQTQSENQETSEAPLQEIRAEKAEESVFDTPLYTATFSNVGGVLKSFKLKGYSDGTGNPVEVINQDVGAKVGWPLALVSENKAVDEELRVAMFSVERVADRLVFEFASTGLHARKTVEFDSENYEFTVQTRLSEAGKAKAHAVVWQGSFGDQSIPDDPAKKNAVYQVETAFERVALGSLSEPQGVTTTRAGVEDPYFVAMFLAPDAPVAVKVSTQKYSGTDGKEIGTLAVAAASEEGKPLRLYVGPKQQTWLSKADPQLASVLDYGYFGFIAEPLVASLLWIHSYVGNFGWSIILLTVAINLIIFPLRLKQQVSMLKMQKIQPHMRRLQDQYKKLKANDPKREQVQREMMGLYKEHGVNPMGGCLPLLLQMPLLLGFYSALAYSIELRRAPWILWIKDLSQYDPYYVIPVLMAVAMVVQQKLTPTVNMDPAQARMMMLMPIVMTFMLLFVSSGLALYWLTGSVVGIAQQVFINKYWSPRAEAKLKPRPKPS